MGVSEEKLEEEKLVECLNMCVRNCVRAFDDIGDRTSLSLGSMVHSHQACSMKRIVRNKKDEASLINGLRVNFELNVRLESLQGSFGP